MLLIILAVIFLQINVVSAASKCDYNEQVELNNTAANIKVSYEEAVGMDNSVDGLPSDVGDMPSNEYLYFKVQIFNVTEDVYVKVTNSQNNDVKYLNYNESQSGVLTLDWKDLDNVVDFTITVYSSASTGCPNEELRIINLTLPRYNWLSGIAGCSGNEEFYYCQKYILSKEDISENEFAVKLEEYVNKKNKEDVQDEEKEISFGEKLGNFIKENKVTIIIISTVIVVGGVVTSVIVIKKRRSRLI